MLPTPSSPFGGTVFVEVTPITPAATAPAAAALGRMSVTLYPRGCAAFKLSRRQYLSTPLTAP